MNELEIAVLVPCHNEAATVAEVVRGFREQLPEATVYVYDNESSDGTAEVARATGAIVRSEDQLGKGNVVRRMFADIDADVYVLADGDATYDPAVAPELVEKLTGDNLDMVVATRLASDADGSFRAGHRAGNKAITRMVGLLFGNRFSDILSGYRAFSRRFVKSFPGVSSGFEIETELTIHALQLRMPVAELLAHYRSRPPGSVSKLSTWSDGARIARLIVYFLSQVRPFYFYSLLSVALATISVGIAWPVFVTFFETGLVPRLPTAVLATAIMLLAFLSLACGLILNSVADFRWEAKRRAYLAIGPTRRGAGAQHSRREKS